MASEIKLKYGLNPNQDSARVYVNCGALPVEILNGRLGYINLLDALNGWQLVKELKRALGLPAAASFKHVSPAGAAISLELTDDLKQMYMTGEASLSPIARAYARARGADRMSSFGDFIALSDECDESAARLISREVSDGIIAPAYTNEALDILKAKKKGAYNIVKIDADYVPPDIETRTCFGVVFEQRRNDIEITRDMLDNIVTRNKRMPEDKQRDLILALITLKYTQSNSVCCAYDGQTIGVGAGQQSRIHCTRLACDKADIWHMRRHPKALRLKFKRGTSRPERDNAIDKYLSNTDALADGEWQMYFESAPEPLTRADRQIWRAQLSGVCLASDAFFPFGDNIERARASGVGYIAQAGGSTRDQDVIDACDKHSISMAFTGARLFHH